MLETIQTIEENRRGVLVIMESGEKLWFSREALCQRPTLQPGQELDMEQTRSWLLPRQYPEALNTAVAMLAQRARASGEIKKKLAQKPYMDDTVDMVLYKLEKEGLLDDQTFAREWAASRSRCQMGKARILQELKQKGIDRETAQAALEELDQEEKDEAAAALAYRLAKRHIGESDSRKVMQKMLMAMARRGYGYEESRAAIQRALEQLEEEA